jgi:hypothetical protein
MLTFPMFFVSSQKVRRNALPATKARSRGANRECRAADKIETAPSRSPQRPAEKLITVAEYASPVFALDLEIYLLVAAG